MQVITIAILYDHTIMYVGLFGHAAVVFHVFCFFSCFYVLPTVCVVVFFQRHLIDLFSTFGLHESAPTQVH